MLDQGVSTRFRPNIFSNSTFPEEDNHEKGKLYKPGKNEEKSATQKAQDYVKLLELDSKKEILNPKKKAQEKKKSNLELFKEELRQ